MMLAGVIGAGGGTGGIGVTTILLQIVSQDCAQDVRQGPSQLI
jgi:hypothetical protein